MIDLGEVWDRNAPPRSLADAQFLAKYRRFAQPAIVAAALIPLLVTGRERDWLTVVVGVGSWLVFLADFVVQTRRRIGYVRSRDGILDVVIVVLTSPWYLLPGVSAGAVVTVLRLARLARIVLVFRGARRLIERLGRAAILAVLVLMAFSWVAFDAENPVNPEFGSYGDSLWWGIVTLTTVGYGDIVPVTLPGRYAGIVIMIMGIGLLGVLSGALASFFKISPQQEQADAEQAERDRERDEVGDETDQIGDVGPAAGSTVAAEHPGGVQVTASSADVAALTREVIDLREQIHALTRHVTGRDPAPGPDQA